MRIGNIDLGNRPVFLAPMEDVTDIGFRRLCKRFGASMVYTEFVSAEALVRDVKTTLRKLSISDDERPVGIQIYGRDIEAMIEAARMVEQAGPFCSAAHFRATLMAHSLASAPELPKNTLDIPVRTQSASASFAQGAV
jgi:hypothetical protein